MRTGQYWIRALTAATLVAMSSARVQAEASTAQRDRPNIVIILADDLGYADIGVHGCADIPTPHIDSIARTGVRCTQGYSSHSID
jgi:hypothetical protein